MIFFVKDVGEFTFVFNNYVPMFKIKAPSLGHLVVMSSILNTLYRSRK